MKLNLYSYTETEAYSGHVLTSWATWNLPAWSLRHLQLRSIAFFTISLHRFNYQNIMRLIISSSVQEVSTGVGSCTCGILKGMCGLWKPTAKKKGTSTLSVSAARLFSNLTASSVLSMSGRVPPGCCVTFTAHSKLAWSLPSSPLHIWNKRVLDYKIVLPISTCQAFCWPVSDRAISTLEFFD